ncbi:hypothetical protein [uncultured Treponema sp.]|uniref:hypothetical protein n=1 Tax=uncultured Treponema sp. TaxID=162155 RepID=UPI0025E2D0A0|nr:hypothetical protein [uncultured Treponema sp.]
MKKFLLKMILLSATVSIFAQNQAKQNEVVEEEIELPDVTTVVNGKTFTAGKDSVPDYTKILPESSAPKVQLPQMEGVKAAREIPESRERASQKEKDIYAQGELGAGYPFYFKGDFSIYRASGNSPFEIDFNHESSEGFAGKKSKEGYFERGTSVHGKKSLFGTYGKHEIEGEYKMSDDGLQLKSDAFSDTVKHTISGNAESNWRTDKGLLISYGVDAAWFNRYGEVMKDNFTSGNYIDSTKIMDLNPFAGIGWTDDVFKLIFTGFYGFQANLEKGENLLKLEDSSSADYSHRGQFKLALSVENESITAGADGSVIVGTATGSKKVLPAFTGIFDLKTESFTEDRDITLSFRGGLDSYQEKIRNLENKYRFAVAPALPCETSDWFASLDLTLPVLSSFEVKSGFEFRKTAFENGIWMAKYENSNLLSAIDAAEAVHNFGLYLIAPEERTEFNTNLGFFADFSPVKAGLEWKSFWKDCPTLEDEHKVRLSLEYQSLDAKWNAGTSTLFALGENADKCPNLSGWAEIRVAGALSIAFEVNDVIKLLHGTSRDFAHSQYITTSGNAVLLAKFQF